MESSLQTPEQHGETAGFPLRALLLSLAAHALAFGMLAPEWNSVTVRPPAQRLEGRLLPAQTAVVAPAVEPVAARSLPPVATPPVRHEPGARAERRPETSAVALQGVSPASTFTSAASAAPVESGGEPRPRASAEPATAALAAPVIERGADAAGLRLFRLALAGEARRLKRYPEMARREGLSGTAEVRIAVEAGGAVRRTDLSRSSGHPLLDAAALEMLGEAVARTSLPDSLRGRSFAVLLPVVFEVED